MKALIIKPGFMGEEDVAHEIEKEVITFDDLTFVKNPYNDICSDAEIYFPHNHCSMYVVKLFDEIFVTEMKDHLTVKEAKPITINDVNNIIKEIYNHE